MVLLRVRLLWSLGRDWFPGVGFSSPCPAPGFLFVVRGVVGTMTFDVKALIEKQREIVADPKKDSVEIALGGELASVEITQIRGDEWQDLLALFPPREGVKVDANLGFNEKDLPSAYPSSRIRVNGEAVDAATWADLYGLLDSPNRANVGAVMWGLNVLAGMVQLKALGKAASGVVSTSPVKPASRRRGSSATSQRK